MNICITVRGGIVEDVWSDDPTVTVQVVDWDAWEDGDTGHITSYLQEQTVLLDAALPAGYTYPATYYEEQLEAGEPPGVHINHDRYPYAVY